MKTSLLLLPVLLAAGLPSLTPAAPGDLPAPADYEELYRWGEYDSLIRLLEPRLLAAPGDSSRNIPDAERSRAASAHLALGVAYWAGGREAEASLAFAHALRLDPDQRLDPLYSTPDMVLRLESLAEEERTRSVTAPAPVSRAGPLEPKLGRKGPSGWLLWTGAAVATGLAGWGAYYFAADRPRRDSVHLHIDTEGTAR